MVGNVHTLGVIGGDLRSVFLAQELARGGYTVLACGLEQAELSAKVTVCTSLEQAMPMMDAVILPVPVSADDENIHAPLARTSLPLDRLMQAARKDQLLCGGQVSEGVRQRAAAYGLQIEDYYKRRELALYNAVPTAEGAIQLAMEELPVTLYRSRVLVSGCGHVGQALVQRLTALGAQVTVAARDAAQRAWARCNRCDAVSTDQLETAGKFDVIFNTVPARLFTRRVLRAIGRDTLLIDLASKPGGVDWDAATALRCRTIWALSLPGRVAPRTAGEILARTVLRIIALQKNEK